MSLRVRCPECRQLLGVAKRKLGQTIKCPNCGAGILVRDESEALQPAEAESSPDDADERQEAPAAPKSDQALRTRSGHTIHIGPELVPDEPALSFRRPATEFEDMDLTPMVDVTFLLLIFFMITASFSLQKTIEVPTPDPSDQGASQSMRTLEDFEANSVIVVIEEDNTIYIDDEKLSDVDRLSDTLLDKRQADRKSELMLTADPRAFHETLVAVVDAANQAGFEKIRLGSSAAARSY